MKVENAKWNPRGTPSGRQPCHSTVAVRNLRVGDVKRIVHDDIACNVGKGDGTSCSLSSIIRQMRKFYGWEVEYYHERPGTLVIKRRK